MLIDEEVGNLHEEKRDISFQLGSFYFYFTCELNRLSIWKCDGNLRTSDSSIDPSFFLQIFVVEIKSCFIASN